MFILLRMFMFSRIHILTLTTEQQTDECLWGCVGRIAWKPLYLLSDQKICRFLPFPPHALPPSGGLRGSVLPASAGSCPRGLRGGRSETDSTGADRLLPRATVMTLATVLRAWLCARCYTDGVSSSHKNPAQYFPHFTDKQTKTGRD